MYFRSIDWTVPTISQNSNPSVYQCIMVFIVRHKQIRKLLAALVVILSIPTAQLRAQSTVADSSSRAIQHRVDSRPDSTRNGFFHASRFNSSFHVQFEGEAAYMFREVGAVTGFQVAWVINHRISIGAAFSILTSNNVTVNQYVNSNSAIGVTPNNITPQVMSAGLTGGYIFRSGKKLAFEPQLGLGWAYIHFSDPRAGWVDPTENKSETFTGHYACISPSISMIWNATKVFRPGIVIGGHAVMGRNYLNVKSYNVSSVYGGVFLRFGTF